MGVFDFFRKGKEEKAEPRQQSARPQQQGQQQGSLVDLQGKQQGANRPPVQNQPAAPAPTVYEIKKGDTLSAIAKQQLGDASKWRVIYEANRDVIKNPDLIYPGQKIKIPKQ